MADGILHRVKTHSRDCRARRGRRQTRKFPPGRCGGIQISLHVKHLPTLFIVMDPDLLTLTVLDVVFYHIPNKPYARTNRNG